MKQLIFQQVWNDLDGHNHLHRNIEVEIETEHGYIICLDMILNAYYNGDEYIIKHVDIKRAWFQFPDFETELLKKYILEIEEHLKS